MEHTTESLLCRIWEQTQSGCEAIHGLLPQITAKPLRTETAAQMEAYGAIRNRAEQLLRDRRTDTPTFPIIRRLAVRGELILETLDSPRQQDLARLLSREAGESAAQMQKTVALCGKSGVDPEALALGQRLAAYGFAEAERLKATDWEM